MNRVRFSFYDRYTNSAFDARPYSITGNEFPKVSNYDERFGGNMGGPLKIPHIYDGSNKTYFFVNFQHETQQAGVRHLLNRAHRGRTQRKFLRPGHHALQSVFKSSRTAHAARQWLPDSHHQSRRRRRLLAYIPLPNVPGQTAQNYLLQSTVPHNTDGVNIHVLHTINAKFNVNGGYNFNSTRQDTLGTFPDIRGAHTSRSQSVDLGLTHNWSPKLIENTHLNWSRSRTQTLSANSYVNDVAGDLGIAGIATDPIDYGFPGISFSSFTGFNDPDPVARAQSNSARLRRVYAGFTISTRLTFGGEVRRIELNSDSNPNPRGLSASPA